jgi:DNA-directed RNA polymerase subunit K/omega
MSPHLVEEASKVIPSVPLLVNLLSRRVRQLGLGQRPMIETGPFAQFADIALQEIIDGKLTYESPSKEDAA